MFFAPPKVKSLSRYSEFGVYLQQGHFWIMLAVAIALHTVIIGIYAMMPREEVLQIPVHVLNIKLGGESGQGIAMPPAMPDAVKPATDTTSAAVAESAISAPPAAGQGQTAAKNIRPRVYIARQRPHYRHNNSDDAARHNASAEPNLATPKKYIRESELAASGSNKDQGNGSAVYGTKEGNEIVERYEQKISAWSTNHIIYPESAKRQGIEGVAVVRIRLDREGHLLSNEIDTSSGNAMLDQAALDMMRASDPFPPVPQDYPEARNEFLMPVSFKLQ